MNVLVIVVWIATCLLWSSTFLFIKLGLREIPPFTFAWLRLAIAAGVLAPLAWSRGRGRSFDRRELAHVAGTGVLLLGVNYGLIFWGAQFIPSGLVAILQSVTPVMALALGWALGSERVNLRKVLALAVGVLGVTLIFGSQARVSGPHAIVGSIAVFCGSACVAFAYVWLKTYGHHLHRTSIIAIQSVAGLAPLALVAASFEGAPLPAAWSGAAWVALLYLALFASVIAFWLNYWLLARMDASAMLMMGVAEIPVAVGLGAIVFGERLPGGTLLGASCVLAAVVAGLTGQGRPARRLAAERNDAPIEGH